MTGTTLAVGVNGVEGKRALFIGVHRTRTTLDTPPSSHPAQQTWRKARSTQDRSHQTVMIVLW